MPKHAKKEVHFYKGIVLPKGLAREDIIPDLLCLLHGEFDGIRPHTVYKKGSIRIFSMRVGDRILANRLIFTVKDGIVIVLAHVLAHNYERCKFLQDGVAKQFLLMHGGDIQPEASIEDVDTIEGLTTDATLTSADVRRVDFEWVNRQIYLTDEQDQVLACQLPAIVTGVPGSGKSIMLLLAARDFLINNPGQRIAIIHEFRT